MRQELHISVHGNFITDKIRDFFYEGNFNQSWEVFSCVSEDQEIFQSIIKGIKAFEGINSFNLVKTKKDDIGYEAFARILSRLS